MIIWGSRGREVLCSKGKFYCPHCKSITKYERKRAARYFTLYFIPIFQTRNLGEWVECQSCFLRFDPQVLSSKPPAPKPHDDNNRIPPAALNEDNRRLPAEETYHINSENQESPSSLEDTRIAELQRLVEQGNRNMGSQNYAEAIKIFEQAIEIEPENPHLRCFVAYAHYKNGEIQEATESVSLALRFDPKDADAYRTAATLFSISGDPWKEAISLRAYLDFATDRESIDTAISRLNALGRESQLMNAAQWLRATEEAHSRTIWDSGEIGNALADRLKAAYPDRASDELNVGLREYLMNSLNERSREWAHEHFQNGSSLLDARKNRAAVLQYVLGLGISPVEQFAIADLAIAYVQAADLDQAEAFLAAVDVLKEPPDRRPTLLTKIQSIKDVILAEREGVRARELSLDLGVRFTLPPGWVKTKTQKETDSELPSCRVTYTGPSTMQGPLFTVSMTMSQDLPSQRDLLKMGRQIARNANAHFTEGLAMSIDGRPSGGVLYKYRESGFEFLSITLCATTGKRAYIFGCTAQCKYEAELKQLYFTVLSSVHFDEGAG